MAGQTSSPSPSVLLAAGAGARAAASLGWLPLRDEEFVAGRMLRLKGSDWCGSRFCPVRGEGKYIVEFHRASDPNYILAVALVDSGADSVLEMLAPSGGRSWIRDGGTPRQWEHESAAECGSAPGFLRN